MRVRHVRLRAYRNYASLTLDVTSNLCVFAGENAQGKTNLLESICYVATARSFRAMHDDELVAWNADEAVIHCALERESGDAEVDIRIPRDKPKVFTINGSPLRKHADLLGYLNVVTFSPDDLMLIKGSPAERRRFLDIELAQVSPAYRRDLADYNRVLRQRNNLLHAIAEGKGGAEMLDIWDEQLLEIGSRIMVKRAEAALRLSNMGRCVHGDITNGKETLALCYKPFFLKDAECEPEEGAWESLSRVHERFRHDLARLRPAEMARGQTLAGPQRDDLDFFINGYSVKSYGSQGQVRTAVLSCKLAEIEFMRSETGEYPVLLLDDVMSELDAERRRYFVATVNGRVQTFITTTTLADLAPEFIEQAQVARIVAGKLIPA